MVVGDVPGGNFFDDDDQSLVVDLDESFDQADGDAATLALMTTTTGQIGSDGQLHIDRQNVSPRGAHAGGGPQILLCALLGGDLRSSTVGSTALGPPCACARACAFVCVRLCVCVC